MHHSQEYSKSLSPFYFYADEISESELDEAISRYSWKRFEILDTFTHFAAANTNAEADLLYNDTYWTVKQESFLLYQMLLQFVL